MSEFQVGDRVVIARNQRETHSEYTDCGDLYSVGDVGTITEVDTDGLEGMAELPYFVHFEETHVDGITYHNRDWWVGKYEVELENPSPEYLAERERRAKMTPLERKIEKLWKQSNYVKGKEHAEV